MISRTLAEETFSAWRKCDWASRLIKWKKETLSLRTLLIPAHLGEVVSWSHMEREVLVRALFRLLHLMPERVSPGRAFDPNKRGGWIGEFSGLSTTGVYGMVSVVVVGMGEGRRSESKSESDHPVTGLHTRKGGCAGTNVSHFVTTASDRLRKAWRNFLWNA